LDTSRLTQVVYDIIGHLYIGSVYIRYNWTPLY